jgi:hypothetical protein
MGSCALVELLRCRFIDVIPTADVTRTLDDDSRDPTVEVGAFVVVEDRGRVAGGDFALLDPAFLVEVLWGVPLVLFLYFPFSQSSMNNLSRLAVS